MGIHLSRFNRFFPLGCSHDRIGAEGFTSGSDLFGKQIARNTDVQANTYQALVPFLGIAVIYLAMVMVLSWLLGKMERRLRKSDLR